ncbi:MAG: hypothetical protein A2418_01440 [Candidatus Brennerbacteria bacterium RIFOXYC1_FULL_41_11]|nr:MAG: hypothetical protein A2391_00215 [Candidatus Brennerbacteria bacterium RIFOXYB1_FULL_41_13]OGY39234.1 MAG: hypothetical protein A2418_01440 [Candidatus Brennerbacteria bacterium RIFOXYC1_FULL_41_11]
MLLLLSEIFSCDESNISFFIDFSKLKSSKFENEDGAGFLPLNPSSRAKGAGEVNLSSNSELWT